MDTFTHALSGALVARATGPRERKGALPRRTRMWVGFWAAAFPDSDFILRFVDPLTYLTAHRGVTHSILMLPLWAFGLALLFQLLYRGRYRWRAFFGVCALGIATHIAGDVITSFGTMILAPFSDWRAQIPATFIIDPYFTAILVAGLVATWRWGTTALPARLALAVLAAYVGFQAVLQHRAQRVAEQFIAVNRLQEARPYALPQPFSPFHWMAMVEQPHAYHYSYVSLLRREPRFAAPESPWLRRVYASYRPVDMAHWQTVPRYGDSPEDAPIAVEAWGSPLLARYRQFAMFPAVHRVDRAEQRTCVWFNDLRFALVGRTLPFRFGACRRDASMPWRIYQLEGNGEAVELFHAVE